MTGAEATGIRRRIPAFALIAISAAAICAMDLATVDL
jgi:hypothetical protein